MRDRLGVKAEGQIRGRSTQDRVEWLESIRKPLDVRGSASITKIDVFGQVSGTLKPHRGPTDDHELNVRIIKNSDRFFELHFLLELDLFCGLKDASAFGKAAGPLRWGAPQSCNEQSQINAEFLGLGQIAP